MKNIEILVRRSLTLIFAVAAVSLAGCDKLRTVRTPQNVSVIELPGASNGCACPTAKRYQITNNGPGTWSPNATVYSRDPLDAAPTKTLVKVSLPIGQSQTLECSVQPVPTTKQCLRSVVTVVASTAYGGDINESMKGIIASTAKADLQSMKRLPDPTANCATQCKSDSATNCLQFDASKSGSVDLGRSIALLLGKSSPIITKDDIVRLIGDTSVPGEQKQNVCLRSEFVFEGQQAYNVGMSEEACQMRASTGGKKILDIVVPRTVSFTHTTSIGGNFRTLFQYEQASPTMIFADSTNEHYLGGPVLEAGYDSGKFWLESAKHYCLAVKVN